MTTPPPLGMPPVGLLIALAVSFAVIVWIHHVFARRGATQSLLKIGTDESGAAYSLPLVLTVPIYALMLSTVVEVTLVLGCRIGVQYAAYAAARAATVWVPAEILEAERMGMIHLAAANAMTPFASGHSQHVTPHQGNLVANGSTADDLIEAYKSYSSGAAPEEYLRRKWRYAAVATGISLEIESDEYDSPATVAVTYEVPMNVPLVGRFLGHAAPWGANYNTYKLTARATLGLERPKSEEQTLGIAYGRDLGFESSATVVGDMDLAPGSSNSLTKNISSIYSDPSSSIDSPILSSENQNHGPGDFDDAFRRWEQAKQTYAQARRGASDFGEEFENRLVDWIATQPGLLDLGNGWFLTKVGHHRRQLEFVRDVAFEVGFELLEPTKLKWVKRLGIIIKSRGKNASIWAGKRLYRLKKWGRELKFPKIRGDRSTNTRVFYGTPQGQLIEAPAGYRAVTARNGKGLVLLPERQALGNNSSIIRYAEPNVKHTNGSTRYYNSNRQPLNPLTGKPGADSVTHVPLDHKGPLRGYPGR